jgi:hypothetical protein
MAISLGRRRAPLVRVTYSKRCLYAGHASELLLPEKLRFSSVLAQQIPKVTCLGSATQSRKARDDLPNKNEGDFGPGISDRDRCLHLR